MAEVATKKSLNVVSSNNKSNDVCSVLSNKSLIDVDNNKSTLNNRLTSLCDEDEEEDERNGLSINEELILDTGSDDKSLSELIENELALRICASKLESTVEPDIADETAAFIASEVIQYTIAEDHYYQNGVTESVSDLDQVDSNLNQAWSPDLSSPSSPSHEVLPDDADKPNLKEQDEESGETVIVCSNKQDLSESIDCPEEFEEEPNEQEDACTMSSKEAERVDLDEKDVSSPCNEELVMTCNAGEVNEVKDDSEDKQQEQMNVDHSLNDDAETREEVKSNGNTVTTTSCTTSTKSVTKKKKKIVEASTIASDASANHSPKTKKTKKSKKSDLEKENISVNPNTEEAMLDVGSNRQVSSESIEFSEESDLSNVNVKSMTQTYVSETSRSELEKSSKEVIATGVSIKQLCRSFVDISNDADLECRRPVTNQEKSSFNKINASAKSVLHVRSVDAGKVQQQLNAVGQNGDVNPKCHSCGKVVFQMERTKAESLVWHKNCFRCVQCSKPLNVDNYQSHESTLYCKPHFKELFLPKPVEETEQPMRPRKPELIIRENNPKELPPDVVRASDKPDLGLEELSTLNVKSRFQVFEKATTENATDVERLPSQVAVKKSPSILSKLAKFQAKGMDIGVSDETLNGIPYEESSESEEEVDDENENEENESDIVKAKRSTRERPMSFTKMGDTKNRWESISQQGRRETQREARKEEQATIRCRLFMGKQGKMKEMYQQAVADSERVTKINALEEIQHSTNARSIKERFERGEPIATSDDEDNSGKPKPEKPDEEVIAAGIGRQSRSLFLELDASAAKSGRPVTPVNTKTTSVTRHARDMDSPEREIYRDPEVVRSEDKTDDVVHTDTARKMLSIFRQMEENATREELPDGPKPLKRFTPPPQDKFAKTSASDSEPEAEEENGLNDEDDEEQRRRDSNYVRASDKVEDDFLKQAQKAARAKTLRAKFEHWEETVDGKNTSGHVAEMEIGQGEQSSIESASSLRARFESLGTVQNNESPRTPKVKVSRFVDSPVSNMDPCEMCQKRVYPLEKVETNNKIFHKQCFRCLHCNCVLRMDTFTLNNGKLYCIPHFKQLFITRGNYDEGFGIDPHKNKWNGNGSNPASPIVVSNGDH